MARADIGIVRCCWKLQALRTMPPRGKGGHLFFTCNLHYRQWNSGILAWGRNTGIFRSSVPRWRCLSRQWCSASPVSGLSGEPAYDQQTNHNHDENRHLRIGVAEACWQGGIHSAPCESGVAAHGSGAPSRLECVLYDCLRQEGRRRGEQI